jgi:O-antigen ligase
MGRGYGTYDGLKYRILDNQYLGLLVTVGVIGTAAYLIMLLSGVTAVHRFARGKRASPVPPSVLLALAAGVLSFVVGSALFDVLSFPHVTYELFFVLALIHAGTQPPLPAAEPPD